MFLRGDARLRLTLKPDMQDRIGCAVQEVVRRSGADTAAYFDEIRRLSPRCWIELDRREIFLEAVESNAARPANR